ncbi:Hint domain-containing protein [Roseovarius sp. EL26]|uniref:Hint domain-containing protein n=1 Tax=Roseovarius sp. EL26 TaxID=2126672 RepID=UPI000EA2104F|nr:Hint domain-containing protein [Roseovarius sp. EL26]
MPDIDGTNEDDDIGVTSNNGTLGADTIAGPIDNVEARQGNDTIAITDSTLSGRVRGNGGNDEISVSNSTVTGNLAGNGGADTITVNDSILSARLNGGGGDDTVFIEGTSVTRVNLGNNNDSLDFVDSSSSQGLFGGGGTDALNLPLGTIVTDDALADPFTVELGVAYTLTSGSFLLPSGQTVSYSQFENGTGIACFTAGTLIATADGAKPVEEIRLGDLVLTMDCGLQPVRWIGARGLSERDLYDRPELRPVLIRQGALGDGYPAQDLKVSPQHRILIRSRIAKRMFGHMEVLIPAIKLLDIDGVEQCDGSEDVAYFHLMFDMHQVIFSNGQPSESLYAGQEALKSLQLSAYLELLTLFPELQGKGHRPPPARAFVKKTAQISSLLSRHKKNDQPLLSNRL